MRPASGYAAHEGGTARLPQRLNLALARNCFVRCPGCYSNFGRSNPDLGRFLHSVERFAALGVREITLSGGDPLTLNGLPGFLRALRDRGMRSIKVDTVGTSLLDRAAPLGVNTLALKELTDLTDVIALPLDGWSNCSVALFRHGRPELYDETRSLLQALDEMSPATSRTTSVVINTVLHLQNIRGLSAILAAIAEHPSITDWSIFQYTATDQSAPGANEALTIDAERYVAACETLRRNLDSGARYGRVYPNVEFRSQASRLGDYLLVNSDGEAWLPDECGKTIELASVFGRERAVLESWAAAVDRLADLRDRVPGWPATGRLARMTAAG